MNGKNNCKLDERLELERIVIMMYVLLEYTVVVSMRSYMIVMIYNTTWYEDTLNEQGLSFCVFISHCLNFKNVFVTTINLTVF